MKNFLSTSLVTLCVLALCNTASLHAQFTQNSSRSLFSDVRAYRVGDAITILIVEETSADNTASTDQRRKSDLGASASASEGGSSYGVGVDLGTSNNFSGRGQTTRNERFRTRLSARVIAVESNGNLKIEGKRTFQLNGENQSISITGFVRPVDLQTDNTIPSYNIMDLGILYEGEGVLTDTQEPGLITKFLRMLF